VGTAARCVACTTKAAAEADLCRDDKRVDGQFAAGTRRGKKVTGDSCDARRARVDDVARLGADVPARTAGMSPGVAGEFDE